MNDDTAIRAWFGWRAGHLAEDAAGFDTFSKDLRETFLPATWLVMRNYGLRAYVPTLLREDKPARVPDEIALLLYQGEAAYERNKRTVEGRSYGVMHRALFEFGAGPRKSRSDWAGKEPVSTRVRAFRRRRSGAGLPFDSPDAVAIVVVLDGPAQPAPAPAVFEALGHAECEAVAVCEGGLTVAWLAAPQGADPVPIAHALQAALGLAEGAVVAAHAAAPAKLGFSRPDEVHPSEQHPAVDFAADRSVRFVP